MDMSPFFFGLYKFVKYGVYSLDMGHRLASLLFSSADRHRSACPSNDAAREIHSHGA